MRRVLFTTSLVLALALQAQADHCTTWSSSAPEIETTAAGGSYYVEANGCYDLCDYWIYEEANGIEGLQRGDEMVDDTCHGMIDGDAIVF